MEIKQMPIFEPLNNARQLFWGRVKQIVQISDRRVMRIALLFFMVWILHGVLDPGISYIGIEVLGLGREGNPLMRIPMQQGLSTFILFHFPLWVGLFVGYLMTARFIRVEFEEGRQRVYYLALIGLTIFIGWGVWLNISNIAVLVASMN